jgi:hypothetical protein
MVTTTRISVVDNAATLLYAATGRALVRIEHVATGGVLYIGPSSMTSYTDGCPSVNDHVFELQNGDEIYGILETGSGSVGVLTQT